MTGADKLSWAGMSALSVAVACSLFIIGTRIDLRASLARAFITLVTNASSRTNLSSALCVEGAVPMVGAEIDCGARQAGTLIVHVARAITFARRGVIARCMIIAAATRFEVAIVDCST